jgi:hypothetical protein
LSSFPKTASPNKRQWFSDELKKKGLVAPLTADFFKEQMNAPIDPANGGGTFSLEYTGLVTHGSRFLRLAYVAIKTDAGDIEDEMYIGWEVTMDTTNDVVDVIDVDEFMHVVKSVKGKKVYRVICAPLP